jgi:hypothetical protein
MQQEMQRQQFAESRFVNQIASHLVGAREYTLTLDDCKKKKGKTPAHNNDRADSPSS